MITRRIAPRLVSPPSDLAFVHDNPLSLAGLVQESMLAVRARLLQGEQNAPSDLGRDEPSVTATVMDSQHSRRNKHMRRAVEYFLPTVSFYSNLHVQHHRRRSKRSQHNLISRHSMTRARQHIARRHENSKQEAANEQIDRDAHAAAERFLASS
jgi:hypothetical protein